MSDIIRLYATTDKYNCIEAAIISFKRTNIIEIDVLNAEEILDAEYRDRWHVPATVKYGVHVRIHLSNNNVIRVVVYKPHVSSFLNYLEEENPAGEGLEIFDCDYLK